MIKRTFSVLLILSIAAVTLGACSSAETADPATAVERYLQAKVESDGETIRELLCADMEAVLERELRTFESVSGARLEGMACERVGDSDVVACDGKIVALYGAEETEFPLTSYRVVEEDGQWKWCGEAGG